MQIILEIVLNYIYTLVIFNALRLKSKHKTINLSKTIHFIKKFILSKTIAFIKLSTNPLIVSFSSFSNFDFWTEGFIFDNYWDYDIILNYRRFLLMESKENQKLLKVI